MWQWLLPLLQNIGGVAGQIGRQRLMQGGVGGRIGGHYLSKWAQQEEETPQMLTQDQSIQPIDFASGDIAPPGLFYNQQYPNRQLGEQNWNQPESFQDLLFRILLNTRR